MRAAAWLALEIGSGFATPGAFGVAGDSDAFRPGCGCFPWRCRCSHNTQRSGWARRKPLSITQLQQFPWRGRRGWRSRPCAHPYFRQVAACSTHGTLKAPNAAMKPGGMTPPTLNATDLAALVSYVSSLGAPSVSATGAGPTASPPAPTITTGPPPDTSHAPSATVAATAAGEAASPATPNNKTAGAMAVGKLYQSEGCAACDGQDGKGTQRAPASVDVGNKFSSLQRTGCCALPPRR